MTPPATATFTFDRRFVRMARDSSVRVVEP